LQRSVSYLTYEIKNGGGGGGGSAIETINNITPDASHNFQFYAGSNITIDPSGNGLNISGVQNGTNYSDYLFWDASANQYQVGSSNVHIGSNSGFTQYNNSVAIGNNAGQLQGVGYNVGGSVAIGDFAGQTNQSGQSIAIGRNAGQVNQGSTGRLDRNQYWNCVAIGTNAGQTNQQYGAIAIGLNAGSNNLGVNSVAIGTGSARTDSTGIFLGYSAGGNNCRGIAIGNYGTEQSNQARRTIAIGDNAGASNQAENSIIFYAGSGQLTASTSGLFIEPVRNLTTNNLLYYNTTTREITYAPPIRLLNQSISSAVVSSWNNGATLTIPANSRFKVEVIIATNYNPAFMIPNPPPWVAFSISLYTASRYYGVTMGDPSTTSNYIYSQCSPINSSGMVIPVKSTALVSDLFDLSTDSATSANICFYFINWDNTNIGALNYSVVITPI
jgi:hypothetical protein